MTTLDELTSIIRPHVMKALHEKTLDEYIIKHKEQNNGDKPTAEQISFFISLLIANGIAIGYFAINRALQQRWNSVFEELVSSPELCQNIAYILNEDKDLQIIIFSEDGKEWLKNKNLREFAINFLRTQRQQSVEKMTSSGSGVRVYELSKELGFTNKSLLNELERLGIKVGSDISILSDDQVGAIKEYFVRNE